MKGKQIAYLAAGVLGLVLGTGVVFSDDEMQNQPAGGDGMSDMERGADRVPPKKDALTAWSEYFFGKPIDPLSSESIEEAQRHQEVKGKRVQAGADFTQAATSLAAPLAPSPTTAANVATMAIGEGTAAVVEQATTPPPENPSAFTRFCRWVASWFK